MRALHFRLAPLPPARLAGAAASRRLQARPCPAARARRGAWLRLSASAEWQQVPDAASGKPYWWNKVTNATAWELPAEASQPETPASETAQLSYDELDALLSATQPVYLSKVVEPHRDTAFSDAFTVHLTQKIAAAAGDAAERERLEKLRARLANPLIRQPPPFV